MPLTLTAAWRAKEGSEQRIAEILRTMVGHTTKEPGCVQYVALQSQDDPREFLLFEQYRDEAALQAHQDAGYFRRHVLEEAVPLLESRVRRFYSVL